jgi:hypothetical protein
MTSQTSLVCASVLFAVLWTAGMIWWAGIEIVNIVGFSVAGVLAGVLWYFGMRWWLRRKSSPP